MGYQLDNLYWLHTRTSPRATNQDISTGYQLRHLHGVPPGNLYGLQTRTSSQVTKHDISTGYQPGHLHNMSYDPQGLSSNIITKKSHHIFKIKNIFRPQTEILDYSPLMYHNLISHTFTLVVSKQYIFSVIHLHSVIPQKNSAVTDYNSPLKTRSHCL